jgi:serine/threonine-protein kinase
MKTKSLLLFCLLLAFSSPYSASQAPSALVTNGSKDVPKENAPKIYSKNPEANALYIQGLGFLRNGKPWAGGSVENAKKALKLFRQAAQKDPNFARAYIGQADALDAASFSVPGSMAPVKVYREQEALALKAIALDDSLPQAHSMLAEISYDNDYNWPRAEQELKRQIELDPDVASSHTQYALFLGKMGRFEEAEAQAKLALKLNEKSASPNRALVEILYWQHKDDEALAQGLEALRKDQSIPTHFLLGFVYIHKGDYQKGIEEMKLATALGDAGTLGGLVYAYAMAGDKPGLKKALEQFNHHPAHDHVFYRLAAVYVALGDKDRAINLIEKDYQNHCNWLTYSKVDPVMDPLRQDPRFKALMRKMKFEE